MFGDVLYKKVAFLHHENTDLKRSQNYLFLFKNFKFLHLSNLGTFGLEKIFGDVLDRKLASLDLKNTYLKKLQNLDFSKGVSPISSFFL